MSRPYTSTSDSHHGTERERVLKSTKANGINKADGKREDVEDRTDNYVPNLTKRDD